MVAEYGERADDRAQLVLAGDAVEVHAGVAFGQLLGGAGDAHDRAPQRQQGGGADAGDGQQGQEGRQGRDRLGGPGQVIGAGGLVAGALAGLVDELGQDAAHALILVFERRHEAGGCREVRGQDGAHGLHRAAGVLQALDQLVEGLALVGGRGRFGHDGLRSDGIDLLQEGVHLARDLGLVDLPGLVGQEQIELPVHIGDPLGDALHAHAVGQVLLHDVLQFGRQPPLYEDSGPRQQKQYDEGDRRGGSHLHDQR